MTILATYEKPSAGIETYSINYSDDLNEGDNISSASVSVTPPDLTVTAIVADPRVKMTVSGGVNKAKYTVTVTANTDDGRRLIDEFQIKINDH